MKSRLLLAGLLSVISGVLVFTAGRWLHLDALTDPVERVAVIALMVVVCVLWGACASAVLLKTATVLDRVVALGLVALVVLTGLAVAGQYAGATLFAKLEKLPDSAIGLWTLRDYWHAFGDMKAVKRSLQIATAVSVMVPLLPIAAVVAALVMKPKRDLHGDARFAYSYEVRRYGLLDEANGRTRRKGDYRDPTIIVGKYKHQYLTFRGSEFVMVAAPTRSFKGVAIVIPNLLTFADSAVVLDVKGENFDLTSRYRQACGQQVVRWAPFDQKGFTHRWNPLHKIAKSPAFVRVGRLQAIAARLYHTADARNKFFYEQASDLFIGLALYLMEMTGDCTFGQVLRLATTPDKKVREHLMELMQHEPQKGVPLSGDCLGALSRVLASPDETMLNIVATFNAGLRLFSNPIVDQATSACDFELDRVRRERMSIYVVLPVRELAVASLLGNLFFTQWIEDNLDVLPGEDPTIRYQCLGILDEFTALGRIEVIDKGNAFIAGYWLRLLTILQSKAQMEPNELYGAAGARTLMTNHAVLVAYAPRNQQDAKELSETLGTFTEKATSRSRNHGRNTSTGTNTSDQGRALMLDQELKRMESNQEIVLGFQRPILCEKAAYFEDDLFIDRMRSVSPMLAAIDKRLPNEEEIKAAWQAGELRATGIPTHNPETYHAVLSAKAAGEIRLARQAGAKPLTAAELLALDQQKPGPLTTDMVLTGFEADLAELGMVMRDDVREMLAGIRFDFNLAAADAAAESQIEPAATPADHEVKEVAHG
ncbi:type IV secretory system conjugative DNA transfer family protein [Burkholderia sp. Ac-20353]|uniref:type IV secretory system conjugative DNA transfer family protein n=1 Tax=Burkholderia sp. Ac-20353 TaxID=2703894 RepID=UPI00197C52A9|nr:type IV secretory system conjugative DNA transfer family protein [Burkholderia sp. Ac-20353]MBN3786096.1 type IV secretory system conjugative DNA transfer family protein [Burkholderia sp. Ac-20353]